MRLVAAAAMIVACFCHGSAFAGPDWETNPICRRAEFYDDDAFDRCRNWIRGVRQPVVPGMEDQNRATCCSEGDAYEADDFELGPDGSHFAIITREYSDVTAGTKVFIPAYKFNLAFEDGGNPTGHGIVFLQTRGGEGPAVLCYFAPLLQ